MSKEEIKLVLEALYYLPDDAIEAIEEALEAALAKQEGQSNFCAQCEALSRELKAIKQEQRTECVGEPVAWRVRWPKIGGGHTWIMSDKPLMQEEGFVNEALYTTPQQRKPLTIQDVEHLWRHTNDYYKFARAIEAAHGIKE